MKRTHNTPLYAYEMIKAVVAVMRAHPPSVWEDWTPAEVLAACEACDQAGELGSATPVRVSACVVEWISGDDEICIASYTVSETEGGAGKAWVK